MAATRRRRSAGLAAAIITRRDPAAIVAVLPADQHVRDRAGFAHVLDIALTAAEQSDVIATIGIAPTRAETRFGYLEVSEEARPGAVLPVARFVEAPDRAAAERYVWSPPVERRHLLRCSDAPPRGTRPPATGYRCRGPRDCGESVVRARALSPPFEAATAREIPSSAQRS